MQIEVASGRPSRVGDVVQARWNQIDGRVAEVVGRGVNQHIQCLFDAALRNPVRITLDALVVDLDDNIQVAGRTLVRISNRPVLRNWWTQLRLMVAVMPTTT